MAKYTYDDLFQILKAQGAFDNTSGTYTFTANFTIDLTPYQDAVLALDFKDFKDDQLSNPIKATAAIPSLDQLIGVNGNGENSHIPNASDANILIAADRVVINAKRDFGMLFGMKGVALSSPSRVNIDAGQSITLYGHEGVYLGIPNKGNKNKDNQPELEPTKGHPTPDQEYDPLVLGYKLANLLEDILFVLKSAELVSGVSPVKFQPSTQAEFGLLANRIPEILSNYAYIDGLSHEQINKTQLESLKIEQKKVKKFVPPTQLVGALEGGSGTLATGISGNTPTSTPAGLGFISVPSSVTPTSAQYVSVEGGHGAYWPSGNPFSNVADPRISPGAGDNLHSFTSTVKGRGRTMDTQIEAGLKEFKQKYNKPADVVGMTVQMNEKATTRQLVWKVLIQESKDGIHRGVFTTNGSAKSKETSLSSTISQIDTKLNKPNFKKIYYFEHDIGSLLITQIFALHN